MSFMHVSYALCYNKHYNQMWDPSASCYPTLLLHTQVIPVLERTFKN